MDRRFSHSGSSRCRTGGKLSRFLAWAKISRKATAWTLPRWQEGAKTKILMHLNKGRKRIQKGWRYKGCCRDTPMRAFPHVSSKCAWAIFQPPDENPDDLFSVDSVLSPWQTQSSFASGLPRHKGKGKTWTSAQQNARTFSTPTVKASSNRILVSAQCPL